MNLGGNAIKFTTTGSVMLRVHAFPDQRFRFTVIDTDPGLDPSQQARLFHAFSQVDSSASRQVGGSGLGLAISQRRVGMMGGCIEVNSEFRSSAEFHFAVNFTAAPTVA